MKKSKYVIFTFGVVLYICVFLFRSAYAEEYKVPIRTEGNVIIASYNIKWFGQLKHDLNKLAQVIQCFDICGIVEVKEEKTIGLLVKELEKITDKQWNFAYGIRTRRPKGLYYESYAVVWRTDRVSLGNGIISNIWDNNETYRNDPYLISFYSGKFDFILFLVHTRWESDEEGTRENEIKGLSEKISFMKGFMDERDIILAGDFNYTGKSLVLKKFTEDSLFTQIDPNLKSTFKGDSTGYNESYDHIFISKEYTTEYIDESSILDSTKYIYGDNNTDNMIKSKEEISDHLPVWAIFNTLAFDDD